jgi:molybdate transport system ATP-binding protein
VLARDVSVARQAPGETSILNVLPVVLVGVQVDGNTALLRLRTRSDGAAPDGAHLLARITRKSFDSLRLREGDAVFAQVKGVALM